ncbi:MAG: glycosyltransferase family 4 protein [Chloroflexota bacterium]
MRALILSKALVVGTYRQKLVELARIGVEVVAVVPPEWREGGTPLTVESADSQEYRLIVTPMRFNGHFHVHYYPFLPHILAETRPDILHVDEEPYNLATFRAVRAARRLAIPSLFFSWQNLRRSYPPPFSFMERSVYRAVSGGLAGSEEAIAVLRAKGYAGPLFHIPQFGVDPDVFSPSRAHNDDFTVAFPNRLVPAKAPLLALRAFARLPEDSRLAIVGDGPMRLEVEQEARRLNITSRVDQRARIPSADMPGFLQSADVVLLPSLTTGRWKEQFGRVLIEAMACGVPVIASDSGEIPRVVGDAGIIVPEGDDVALADALHQLYTSPTLRREIGVRGRARALALFTHAHIAEATAQAYRHILDRHHDGG